MTLREIVERSNATCKRLVREEDGVVLGVMVVTLMSLFLMAAATFAVGEHIRDRIEIQNAVDAAAYSAAVVQADAISRVAAINQAMAWTYIQMCRRHMEYIQDKWLEEVYRQYTLDKKFLSDHDRKYRFKGFGDSGLRLGPPNISSILINGKLTVSIQEINTARSWWKWEALGPEIRTDRTNLYKMAKAEDDLILDMPERMKICAQEVLRRNLGSDSQNWVTIMIGRNDRGNVGTNHFESYDNWGETHFLRTILPEGQTGVDVLGDGSRGSEWFPEHSSQPWRRYVQQNNMLGAQWTGYADGYSWRDKYGNHDGLRVEIPGNRRGVVLGGDNNVKDGYFDTQPIRPSRLKQAYFENVGGIVVACARSLRHPFQLFIDNGGAGGFYDAFREADPAPRCMVAVASARAGYRDGDTGSYNPYTDSNPSGWYCSAKNLGETDWDAVLIPIRHAWTGRSGGTWATGHEADVLNELWASNWEPIGGGEAARTLSVANLPGAERPTKPIRTGFGTTPENLSKSFYH